jgi:hypothetical protein
MERTNYQYSPYVENLVLDAFKSSGFLTINKTLIKKFGLIGAGILSNYLDKYMYFKTREMLNNNAFFLTYEQQIKQLNISMYTLTLWRKNLQDLHILKITRIGIPAKDWFEINFQVLANYVYNEGTKTQVSPIPKTLGCTIPKTLFKETKYKETKIKNLIKKDDVPWQDLFNQWYLYKKEKGQTYKPRGRNTFEAHLVEISKNNIDTAKQIINQSIANNYAGIWPLKNGYNKPESVKFKDSTVWTF